MSGLGQRPAHSPTLRAARLLPGVPVAAGVLRLHWRVPAIVLREIRIAALLPAAWTLPVIVLPAVQATGSPTAIGAVLPPIWRVPMTVEAQIAFQVRCHVTVPPAGPGLGCGQAEQRGHEAAEQ